MTSDGQCRSRPKSTSSHKWDAHWIASIASIDTDKKDTCSERFFDLANAVSKLNRLTFAVETGRISTWKTRLLEFAQVGASATSTRGDACAWQTETLDAAGDVTEHQPACSESDDIKQITTLQEPT